MLFGAHISLKDGLENAPKRARRAECEVFQFFSRSPRGGVVKPIAPAVAKAFKENCKELGLLRTYIHAPYVMNLASLTEKTRAFSTQMIIDELGRAEILGVKAVVTHLGSAGAGSREQGLDNVIKSLATVLKIHKGQSQLWLEISAGSGSLVGDRAEDFAYINDKTKFKWGLCLDTAHLFGSGYDLRTTSAVQGTLQQWGARVGLDQIKLWHFNDSQVALGSHKDRHAHLGKGEIGLECFRALVSDSRLTNCDAIIETPKDDEFRDDVAAMRLLKSMRS